MTPTGTTSVSAERFITDSKNDLASQAKVTQNSSKLSLLKKIGNVAKLVLKSLVNLALYYLNPSLFAVGFLVGVVFDKHTEMTLQKILSIWKQQPWTSMLLMTVGSIISLPIFLATGSLLCGAELGSSLSLTSQVAGSIRG